MRIPRFRFTIRRMMIAVAVVGIVTWCIRYDRASRRWAVNYSKRVKDLTRLEAWARKSGRKLRENLNAEIAAAEDARDRAEFLKEDAVAYPRHDSTATIQGADSLIRMTPQLIRHLHDRVTLADRRVDYYAAMKAKYERAARYPWFTVAPDPPEPE